MLAIRQGKRVSRERVTGLLVTQSAPGHKADKSPSVTEARAVTYSERESVADPAREGICDQRGLPLFSTQLRLQRSPAKQQLSSSSSLISDLY